MKKGFLALLALIFVLASCGPGLAAKDTLIVADQYDATTMDPIRHNDVPSSRACSALYDTLIFLNDDGSPSPGLAEQWEFVSDTQYKMALRKDVKFHNGETLTAEDVKFSLERAATDLGAPIRTYAQNLAGVDIVDPNTVLIRLKKADYSFFPSLAHNWASIVNRKAVEAAGESYGTVSSAPVGTGPFKFVSWEKGDKYTLERFDNFWGEKAKFRTLVIRSIPEPTNRTIELETGAVDIAYPIAPNDLKRIRENPKLVLFRGPQTSVTYLGFNAAKKPFDDVRIRRGIKAALDTMGIHAAVFRDFGKVPTSIISNAIKYSTDGQAKPHVRDLDLAKKLFADAGIDPKTLKVQIWTNERKDRVDMATIIQAQLTELGLAAEIKVLEWGAYLEGLKKKEHDMFILGWVPSVPDPNFAVAGLLESTSGNNYTFTNDERTDKALAAGRGVPDGPEREKIYKELQAYIDDLTPMVYLFNAEAVAGVQNFVKGFNPKPNDVHSFRETYIEE